MLLHLRSTDYDIATDASPQQVRKLFPHVLLVGAKFGVAMVIHERQKVEVTTFRTDLEYTDGRRPEGVRFSSPREDALRRDFTINGMFYDPIADEVIDYVGGRADLQAGIVRTIGEPAQRFAEDYLRLIRAVRFAVRFGFAIEPATAQAIVRFAPHITGISGERILDELTKMLSRESAGEALALLEQTQLAQAIIPELFAAPARWPAAVRRVQSIQVRRDALLALSAVLAELPHKDIVAITRRWGASNQMRDCTCWMAAHLNDWANAADMPLCGFKRLLANANFARLSLLWRHEEKEQRHSQAQSRRIASRVRAIPAEQIAPAPLVSGDDLKAMGLREGPALGKILRALYDAQLNEQITDRAAAMAEARKMIEMDG